MARKKKSYLSQETVYLRPESKKYVEDQMKTSDANMSFSNMVDTLIYRMSKEKAA